MTINSTTFNKPKFLPDDVRVDMVRMNPDDLIHNVALGEVLYTVVECDAKTHGAEFRSDNFANVLDTIKANKVQAYFVVFEGESGRPRFGGGAIQFPSVLTRWNGETFDHYPAIYREDIFVSPELTSEFRKMTKSDAFPQGVGLGAYLTHEEIRVVVAGGKEDLPYGVPAYGLLGEYAPDNAPIVSSLGKLGSSLGLDENGSAVLHFPKTPLLLSKENNFNIDVQQLLPLMPAQPQVCQNVFTVLWKSAGDQQQIVASFTEAISTFNGETVIRVQITSNGNEPNSDELEAVLSALILNGRDEVLSRGWINQSDIDPVSVMRFHMLKEPKIVTALRNLGAETRYLGSHVMQPITLGFNDVPEDMISFKVPKANPMVVLPSLKDFDGVVFPDQAQDISLVA